MQRILSLATAVALPALAWPAVPSMPAAVPPAQPKTRPARLSVMPLSGSSISVDELHALEPVLVFELGRLQRYEVLSTADINAIFGAERLKDLAGCNDVTCATELATTLDARWMVEGTVSRLDGIITATLTLLDLHAARVARRAQVQRVDEEGALAGALRGAVAKLFPAGSALDTPLPSSQERWLARLDWLASAEVDCSSLPQCAEATRDRLGEIDRILTKAAWTDELMHRRAALEARRDQLARSLDALGTVMLVRGSDAGTATGSSPPVAAGAGSDPLARAIAELAELRRRLHETVWTWYNRDEKTALEGRITLLEAEVARRRSTNSGKSNDEERALENEIAGLQQELDSTRWGWDNRDRKSAVESRIDYLRKTLARIHAATAPKPAAK